MISIPCLLISSILLTQPLRTQKDTLSAVDTTRTSYLVGGPYSVWSRIIDGSGNSLYFNKQGDFSRKMIVPSQRFKY